LEDLALLDGQALELSEPLTDDVAQDSQIMINRVGSRTSVARLEPRSECFEALPLNAPWVQQAQARKPAELPKDPPGQPIYLGARKVAVSLTVNGVQEIREVDTTMEITFRSTEGVFRFLGEYLRAAGNDPGDTWRLGTEPLFSIVPAGVEGDLVSASLLGRRLALDDTHRRRNMQILGLLQQLLNLHKDSADRPVTQPVQIIP